MQETLGDNEEQQLALLERKPKIRYWLSAEMAASNIRSRAESSSKRKEVIAANLRHLLIGSTTKRLPFALFTSACQDQARLKDFDQLNGKMALLAQSRLAKAMTEAAPESTAESRAAAVASLNELFVDDDD